MRFPKEAGEWTNKMIIPTDGLRKKITVEEAEVDNPDISDDGVSYFPGAARPFGFLNRAWKALKAEIKPSDELWTFISSADSRRQFTGLMGVALLRDGIVIDLIVTEMN